jgi:hypothetical protein
VTMSPGGCGGRETASGTAGGSFHERAQAGGGRNKTPENPRFR